MHSAVFNALIYSSTCQHLQDSNSPGNPGKVEELKNYSAGKNKHRKGHNIVIFFSVLPLCKVFNVKLSVATVN